MGLNQAVGVQLDGAFQRQQQQQQLQQQHYHQYHQQLQNQHQQLLLQQQVSGAICGGTLPRNISTWKPVIHATTNFYQAAPGGGVGQPSVAFASENHQGLIPQLHLLHHQSKEICHQGGVVLENPYGIKSNGSITGSTTSPDAYATTTTYSASTSCGSNQPAHQSVIFGLPTSGGGVGGGVGEQQQQQHEKYGQYNHQPVANNTAPNSSNQTNGNPLGEAGRVEQLVISGKQYIHQTSVNRALYPSSRSQQQQRHLQMTSGAYSANAGSTSASLTSAAGAPKQSRNNSNSLYTTSGGSLQSMMKDYLSQQQQQNYLQNQPSLVCFNHGAGNDQTGFQTKQRLPNGPDQMMANNELATSSASHDLAQTGTGKCLAGFANVVVDTHTHTHSSLNQTNRLSVYHLP